MITESTSNNPLAFLQPKQEEAPKGKSREEMGQSDFIQLMIAQMKNQDPTKPLDPNEFMSQLAQFSTVNGIQDLKKSVDSMLSMLTRDQSIKAASLVGHEVLSDNNLARLEAGQKVEGQVQLEGSTTELNLKVYASNGALVRTIPMGMHGSGSVPFVWDGFREDGQIAPPGEYRIVAEAELEDRTVQVPVELRTRVESVDIGGQGGDLTLNLANGRSVPLDSVRKIL
jgi:flagellar basal-body rod modification protein FlgD